MKIKKLSVETINLISAGEVIEGPSDILKELIENSIDSGATEINIDIKSSGIDLIKVEDNGSGILKDDLKICLDKYTTSKLETIKDLDSINSFGFRGEALSTISAVSKFKIISSTTSDGKGYILEDNKVNLISSKKGTTIHVEDLFYNIPVRKKFLKSKTLEYSKLYDTFLAFVLLNPDISFKFNSEKKNIVFPKTNFDNRLVQIYGKEIILKGIKVNISNSLFSITGILTNPSNPIYFPSNFLFINKRFVYSPQIYKAITDSYKDYLMIQQKPFFIIFINLDPKTIDVNVHPKKKVVKLENELLFLLEFKKEISKLLDSVLGKKINKDNFNLLNNFISNKQTNYTYQKEQNSSFKSPSSSIQNTYDNFKLQTYFNNNNLDDDLFLFGHKIIKVLGQINQTFIACETIDGILFIDQHAADERINLEKNRSTYNFVEKQNLIVDVPLNYLTENHKQILIKNKSKLEQLGFSYYLNNEVYFLKTIPLFLNKFFDKNLFLNILKDIEEGTDDILKLKDNLLKLKSCKESIKANEQLSLFEQINLIKKLNTCKDKGICAHGRPTIIHVSQKDLEKLFKRIV